MTRVQQKRSWMKRSTRSCIVWPRRIKGEKKIRCTHIPWGKILISFQWTPESRVGMPSCGVYMTGSPRGWTGCESLSWLETRSTSSYKRYWRTTKKFLESTLVHWRGQPRFTSIQEKHPYPWKHVLYPTLFKQKLNKSWSACRMGAYYLLLNSGLHKSCQWWNKMAQCPRVRELQVYR